MKSFEKFCARFLKYTLLLILLFLTAVSFISTQRCGREALGEIANSVPIYNDPDNIFFHLAGLAAIILLFSAVARRAAAISPLTVKLTRIAASCFTGLLSLLILTGGVRTPDADQIQVYNAALCFNENNFINLSPGGYIEMYPQQLGYVLYLQILLKLFPAAGFGGVQAVNCLFIAGTAYFSNLLLGDLTENRAVLIIGALLWPLFLPLQLLGCWVYGDIPFFCFALAALHFFMMAWKTGKKSYFLAAALAAVLCILFRRHTLILLIAIATVSFVCMVIRKNARNLPGVLAVCLLPLIVSLLTEKQYEAVSGYEIQGIPGVAWVAMGCLERGSTPGWFNNYSVPLYYSLDCDSAKTARAAGETLKEQLQYFAAHSGYAASFVKRKICTQWNDPYFNTDPLIDVDEGSVPTGLSAFIAGHRDGIRTFLSVFQNLIYLGALFYVFFFTEDTPFYRRVLEVTILGGFLFSLLWEANSRYIMPCFLLMLPMAACGYNALSDRLYSHTPQ